MLKVVIFDLDNTLYDYEGCNQQAEKCLFKTIADDFAVTPETAKELLKKAKSSIKNRLGDDIAASHNRLLYMQNICEQVGKNPLDYAMKFYDIYWNSMLDQMELFEYVLPLFDQLRNKGIKIAVLTDMTAHIQYRKLEKLRITKYVDCIVTSEEAGAEKPSEKMFELILQKSDAAPKEALMVGDHAVKDIMGAAQLGIPGILYRKDIEIMKEIVTRLT